MKFNFKNSIEKFSFYLLSSTCLSQNFNIFLFHIYSKVPIYFFCPFILKFHYFFIDSFESLYPSI